MMFRDIRMGTRGSTLALTQARWVRDQLMRAHPGLEVTLVNIKTTGDRVQDAPLAKIGGKGLFVKEIEEALLNKKVDLAVHSMKDVPAEFPAGLHLSAVTRREDPWDVLVSRSGKSLADLPPGARIGTSSLRRQAQLRHFRSDFQMVVLRGNLDTRLKKLTTTNLDGIVLALAGVRRMGLEGYVTEVLSPEISLPAVGQGALGIETRIGDEEVERLVRFLNDRESSIAVVAERAFLKRLEGGCQVPIAAHGRFVSGNLRIEGLVGTLDGKRLIRNHLEGLPQDAEAIGIRLAEVLLDQGARKILEEVYHRPL